MNAKRDETLTQLSEIARRGHDWDGFGSAATNSRSVQRARVFWLELLGASSRVTSPAVVGASDGSVAFVWSNGVEIHFPPVGAIFTIRTENGDARVSDLVDIVEAVDLVPKVERE